MIESQRIDKWIWFARLIKSRPSAQNICKNGLVSVNGTVVKKPNHLVKVGDKLIIEFNYLKRILKIVSYAVLKEVIFPPDLDLRHPDHAIVATAKAIQAACENRKTIMVSRDINMRVISDSVGLISEDYVCESAVTSTDELYQGFVTHLIHAKSRFHCRRVAKIKVLKVDKNS